MINPASAPDPRGISASGQRNSRWMRDVADELRQRILAGEFEAGSFLPTESEFMNEFVAPRSVVRGALDLLRIERLVERQRGAGTFNVSRKVAHRFEQLRAVSAGQPRGAERMQGAIIALDTIAATPFMARNLAVSDGEECLRIEVLVNFDGVPYSLTTNYLPGRFAETARLAPYGGDWWKYLDDLGARPEMADVSVEATAADAYVAPILDVEVGDPILMVTRLVHDTDGRPLNFAFSRSRSDRLVLNMRIPVGGSREPADGSDRW